MFNSRTLQATLVVLLLLVVPFVARAFDSTIYPIVQVPLSTDINLGQTTSVTLSMNAAGTSPTTVYLTSSRPDLLAVPASVVVPTNSSSIVFDTLAPTVAAAKAENVGRTVAVFVTATANGHSAYTVINVH